MAQAPAILVLNGPNLNLLGTREPDVYGRTTLADIESACHERGRDLGMSVECRQSNAEGELVDWIQGARKSHNGLIVNAGALTHTSIALFDALQAIGLPIVEVHLSNIYQRESFRHHSYVSKAANGVICGFGAQGYLMALEAMARLLRTEEEV